MRSLAELEPDLIVDTGRQPRPRARARGHPRAPSSAFARHPRRLRQRLERLLRSAVEEPVHVLRRPVGRDPRVAKRLDIAALHALLRRARLARPQQHGREPRPRGHPLRVLRRRRPAPRLRPTRPHHRRPSTSCAPTTRSATSVWPDADPPAAPPADGHDRRHPRAVPARAQLVREPRRRSSILAGHTHGGQVLRAGLRCTRDELRHPPQAGRRASASGSTGCARRSSTSRPASAPRSTRRCDSRARPRPRCSRSCPRRSA